MLPDENLPARKRVAACEILVANHHVTGKTHDDGSQNAMQGEGSPLDEGDRDRPRGNLLESGSDRRYRIPGLTSHLGPLAESKPEIE